MKSKKYLKLLKRWLFSIIGFTPGKEQLLKQLRFTIGEQYENYEFHLKDEGIKRIGDLEYEAYVYTKDDFKKLFGLEISRDVLLLFNADILSAVYYRFEGDKFDYLVEVVNRFLPTNNRMLIDPFETIAR